MHLFYSSRSAHAGRENQDHIEMRRVGNMRFVALADGQGGRAGGALAAQLATQTALDWLETQTDCFDEGTLRTAIAVADETVEAREGAGYTTLILLVCEADVVAGASVGDSMVLHVTSSGPIELSERQRKNPPLGSGAAVGTPFSVLPRAGEDVVVMSDGVFRFVSLETIARICRQSSPLSVLPNLLALQEQEGSEELPDDWSTVLLRF